MSFVNSPNMNLPVPSVGSESGPQYAFDINACMSLIDTHDHSPGRGVQITPAGININAILSFNNNPATSLSYTSFVAGALASSTLQSVSVAPVSSINELFYTDSNGTQTQITSNGIVNVIASAIPGESYSAGTFIWTQTQSSLPTTPANFDIGSITLRPNVAGTTNGVTLTPPSSISSAYTINLPTIPVANSILLLNSTGAMSTVSGASGTYLAGGSTPVFTAFKAPTYQIFTSGFGTYTRPSPAPLYIEITALGGGGGGGGSGLSPIPATAGGNTTFGSTLVVANGGQHGGSGDTTGSGNGGAGGVATVSGPIQIEAVIGGQGTCPGNVAAGNALTVFPGGLGGNGARGGSGRGGTYNTQTNGGSAGAGTGAGGGGGAGSSTVSYPGAGGGAGGYAVAVINSPSTTYAYTVGAAGSAGTASSSNGGAGGSGILIVKEYYQ